MLEHNHIPSFAALKAKKENELGHKLTEQEKKNLYAESTAVEVPKEVHQAGPTKITEAQGNQLLLEAAEARSRY